MSTRQTILFGTCIKKDHSQETERLKKDWLQDQAQNKSCKHLECKKHFTVGELKKSFCFMKRSSRAARLPHTSSIIWKHAVLFPQANTHKWILTTTYEVAIRTSQVRSDHGTDSTLSNQCSPSQYISVSLVLSK